MSFARVCQSVAVRVGVQASAPWIGNFDLTTAEIVEFVQEAHRQLASEHDWQALLRDFSVVCATPVEQTIPLPADYDRFLKDTMWVSGLLQPVEGPVSPDEMEYLRRGPVTHGVRPIFTLSAGSILLRGLVGGQTLSARYVTNKTVAGPGGVGQIEFLSDADTTLLAERPLILGAVALFKTAKGLPAPEAAMYRDAMEKLRGRDQPVRNISLSGRPHRDLFGWGIFVDLTGTAAPTNGAVSSGPVTGLLLTVGGRLVLVGGFDVAFASAGFLGNVLTFNGVPLTFNGVPLTY